jgi:hypothetical protein
MWCTGGRWHCAWVYDKLPQGRGAIPCKRMGCCGVLLGWNSIPHMPRHYGIPFE